MTHNRDTVASEALDWAVKTQDPAFGDWEAFTTWLERDSAHADAYHAVVGAVAEADEDLHRVEVAPAVALPPERPVYRRYALAASLAVLAAAGGTILAPAFTSDAYRTAPGETRTVALGDGNRLILNGDTELKLAGLRRDRVELERGQVLLRLDGKPKVRVRSGDLEFVDIGTVFEVTRQGADTRMVVAEGAVLADPDGARVKVAAHQMLEARDGQPTLAAAPATSEAGSWESGQLAYADAPVSTVLDDLHRSTGLVFSTSDAIGARRFSGTLSTTGIRKDPASLGPLLGVSMRRSGNRWEVGER